MTNINWTVSKQVRTPVIYTLVLTFFISSSLIVSPLGRSRTRLGDPRAPVPFFGPFPAPPQSLESKFGFSVSVLNDFEAIGYGIPAVDPNDIVVLNDAPLRLKGPIAVLGPGTGLGQCQLFWDEGTGGYRVWPSEGSHADFAPRGSLQRELAAWVEAELGFCEVEHVACGKGLERIAAFLSEKRTGQRRALKPEEVSAMALQNDPICSEALDVFLSIVGAEAGHMALRALARGGVYIAGGIPAKVIERVTAGGLAAAFCNAANAKFTGILQGIPLYVVRDPAVGLKGALEVGCKLL